MSNNKYLKGNVVKFSIGENDRLGVIISSDRFCKRRKDKIILLIVENNDELSEWRYQFNSDDGIFKDVDVGDLVVNLSFVMTIPENRIVEKVGRFSISKRKKIVDAFEKKSLNQREKDGEKDE
mgnify:CR=1 FL=1